MADIRKMSRKEREAAYQSFKRGYQMGAQGLPVMTHFGTPPARDPDDYRRGWEAGVTAYKIAVENEAGRLALFDFTKTLDLESRAFGVLAAAVAWWKGKRPIGWSDAEHLDNPMINAHVTRHEKMLATAVGEWAAELGEPVP